MKHLIAILMTLLVSSSIAWAESTDSIANAIVTRADVQLTFQNDETHPWKLTGNEIENGNRGVGYSKSTFSITYTSEYAIELQFSWRCYNCYSHWLQLYIDGIWKQNTTNSSNTTVRLYLEKGTHTITFRDTIAHNYSSYPNEEWSYVSYISVKEIRPLENTVLSAKSLPLTFTNDSIWPWTTENGYIQNSNYGHANSVAHFSTSFKVDKVSTFSFKRNVGYGSSLNNNYDDYHYSYFTINGESFNGSRTNYTSSQEKISVTLEPGTYTMEWKDTIYNYARDYYTRISDIELTSDWVDVELESAGTLGVEVLYKVDVLTDVKMLKIKGRINADDWATIRQMTNLSALDLSEAKFTDLPSQAFSGLGYLSYVTLPEGLETIGASAFTTTTIKDIHIPSSVKAIGNNAFNGRTRLETVTIGENSQLQSIGNYAFGDCTSLTSITFPDSIQLSTIGWEAFSGCSSLQEFIMPNTVTTLSTNSDNNNRAYTFSGCSRLRYLKFSDALSTIPSYFCYNCTWLTDVHLPKNLIGIYSYAFYNASINKIDFPESLRYIYAYAFYYNYMDSVKLPLKLTSLSNYAFDKCEKLKYVELPSYISSYNYNFSNCPAIQTIVCRSATPPAISNDPFGSCAKKSVTLRVPSFAVVNYKLDSYWYQFGNIVEGDDIDYWRITGPLSLTNNRRMKGKPDVDLYYSGRLTVGGSAPMEMGQFNLYVSQSAPGRLINNCETITADTVNTFFSADRDTWYFITPLHDVDLSKVTVTNDAAYVFRYYDAASRAANGTGSSWKNVTDSTLHAGQGYIFRCNASTLVTLPADTTAHRQLFTTADVKMPLTAYEAEASANKNWNYVGNPYPCYYDIYYMDFTAPITVWTGSTYKAYSIVDDKLALSPMQAFFVQKPDAVDNIIFHREGRQMTTEINHTAEAAPARAPRVKGRYLYDIRLSADTLADETRIVINSKASMGYELSCDASKFMSFNPAVPQLYTLDETGNAYAINERPVDNGTIRLAYQAGQAGELTFSATRAAGDIYLTDLEQDKTVNLNEQDYTFFTDATEGANTSRFVLKIGDGEATGIGHATTDKESSDDDIYDLQGRKVLRPTQKGIYIQHGKKVIL